MRRRTFLAILATVVLSLALAGTGTFLVLRREATRTSLENVRAEAERLAALMTAARESEAAQVNQQRLVASLFAAGCHGAATALALNHRGLFAQCFATDLPSDGLDNVMIRLDQPRYQCLTKP